MSETRWMVDKVGREFFVYDIDRHPALIAKAYEKDHAHLIAAAPDLYEALSACVAWIGEGESMSEVRNAVAALAKARGE